MNDLRSLKESIGAKCEGFTSIALWFSGGSDSMLLLNVLLDLRPDFGILTFDHGWTREQRRAMDKIKIKYDLMTFSYPPNMALLVGKGDEIALVANYPLAASGQGGCLIRDIVDDQSRCAFDIAIPKAIQTPAPIEFDLHILGTKFEDTHFSTDKLLQHKSWEIAGKQMFAPLADWTREDVQRELRNYNAIPVSIDTGDIPACTNCLRHSRAFCPKKGEEIAGVNWDKEANLKLYQEVTTTNV